MNKVKIGSVVKLKPSNRQMNKLDYNSRYIVTKTVPAESYTDDTQFITQVVDQFGNPINLKIVENMFDIVVPEVKIKKFSQGDKVISTRDTPEVPEGFVGYVVEKPSNSCNDYEYAVRKEFTSNIVEYFNEDELELLALGISSMKIPLSPSYGKPMEDLTVTPNDINGIARPILEERKIGKVQMNLFDEGFPNAVMEVAKVMTWAAENKGYKPHDWVNLPDAESSFPSAASRHRVKSLMQKVSGLPVNECVDEESGILHKAHEAFNVLAELELMLRGEIK